VRHIETDAHLTAGECDFIFDLCISAGFMIVNPQGGPSFIVPRGNHTAENLRAITQDMSQEAQRQDIVAINSGELAKMPTETDPVFGFDVVTECPNVPSEILKPRNAWADKAAYDAQAKKLAKMFNDNFAQFADGASAEVKAAAPKA